ncbi:MAG TPA: 50S ribosomal protein L29 [Dehalococcoidia bacterium]|nr:50S ribosomal protein L29 [Dehalococcoidia bacterium]HLB29209.1 50S ribosomal protein L29 [Dehalococcoidia bacterium]
MSNPKTEEARRLGAEDLERAIEEAHRQLFHLRFQLATRQLASHREIRKTRRHLARLKTIKRQRELVALRLGSGQALGSEEIAGAAPPPLSVAKGQRRRRPASLRKR